MHLKTLPVEQVEIAVTNPLDEVLSFEVALSGIYPLPIIPLISLFPRLLLISLISSKLLAPRMHRTPPLLLKGPGLYGDQSLTLGPKETGAYEFVFRLVEFLNDRAMKRVKVRTHMHARSISPTYIMHIH